MYRKTDRKNVEDVIILTCFMCSMVLLDIREIPMYLTMAVASVSQALRRELRMALRKETKR